MQSFSQKIHNFKCKNSLLFSHCTILWWTRFGHLKNFYSQITCTKVPAAIGRGHEQQHTLTPKVDLESTINITQMFLNGGRKPKYTGRTCKLHTERLYRGRKASKNSFVKHCLLTRKKGHMKPVSELYKNSNSSFQTSCIILWKFK